MNFVSPWLIILILLGAIGGAAYFYYKETQNSIRELEKNNATLLISQEANLKTINSLEESLRLAERNAELQRTRAIQAERYQDKLAEKLRRHDLTVLSLQKPGLIEKRVNDGTREILQQLEQDSLIPDTQ